MADTVALREVEIFLDLVPGEIKQLEQRLHPHSLATDEVLFKEGDDGQELYIVESGRLGVSVQAQDGTQLDIAEFGPGDFFGEMSIFEQEARSATCYTKSESTLLSLHEHDLIDMITNAPDMSLKILSRMLTITRSRLDNTGSFLSDMVQWGEAARKRSITDELTGFYNRRYLDESLPSFVKKAAAGKKTMALCMLDLDHFRNINEELSHAIGDQVIHDAVDVLKEVLHPGDIAVRYGGDEFVLIMPETGKKDATDRAWAVCKGIAALDVLSQYECSVKRVTTSIGLAAYPDDGKTAAELSAAADKALYESKETGRNRVTAAGSTSS